MNTPDTGDRPLAVFDLASEQDVFALRRRGIVVAEVLGLERQDQVRLATALSELGRDRLGGADLTVTFALRTEGQRVLTVTFESAGGSRPGPEALALASRLVHRARYEAAGSRDRIVVEQPLPPSTVTRAAQLAAAQAALRSTARTTSSEDVRAQTRDLIATLEETRAQREELRRLNEELEETNKGVLALYTELSQELEETNRGVVALHKELDDKSRQLRETGEARIRLWNTISHELRTPVNAIVALSGLLAAPGSTPLDAEQAHQVGLIAASGHTLSALVNDLLDVAKAESGQLDIVSAPVDLRTLVGQLASVLRGAYPAQDVTLITPEPTSLPVVFTDETLLTRILRNLLSNALKFTEKGEVRLTVGEETTEGESWFTVTVTDTGVGIPEPELARVFEEFYQIRGPHQRGHRGTGLGLPYARTLSELLGGTLTLTSTPGIGTRADVRLPHRPDSAQSPAHRSPASE